MPSPTKMMTFLAGRLPWWDGTPDVTATAPAPAVRASVVTAARAALWPASKARMVLRNMQFLLNEGCQR